MSVIRVHYFTIISTRQKNRFGVYNIILLHTFLAGKYLVLVRIWFQDWLTPFIGLDDFEVLVEVSLIISYQILFKRANPLYQIINQLRFYLITGVTFFFEPTAVNVI
jgi:hypothetical protein